MYKLLCQHLLSEHDQVWQSILRTCVNNTVARHALSQLDYTTGTVGMRWCELDEPQKRKKLFSGQPFWNNLTELIVTRPKLREEFNGLLHNNRIRKVNAADFRKAVYTVVPAMLQRQVSQDIIKENPFPTVWKLLANLLAADIHKRTLPSFPEPEWSLLQGLLFIGFFSTCRLPLASHVSKLFDEHRSVMLSVRGVFLRIPEAIGPSGVLDSPVPVSNRPTKKPVTLVMAELSPLVNATMSEANQMLNGNGLLHRMIPVDDPRYRPPASLRQSHFHLGFTISVPTLFRYWATHRELTRRAPAKLHLQAIIVPFLPCEFT